MSGRPESEQAKADLHVDLRGARGVQLGDGNTQHNIFNIRVWPRGVRIAAVTLVVAVLAGGIAWGAVTWGLPLLASNYKTEFLVDTTGDAATGGLQAIADSVKTVAQNSGDYDALAVRRFGGTCGDDDNTSQLMDFGTGNRSAIAQAVNQLGGGGTATLERGIVEAISDFAKPFSLKAKQVSRVIVITRHGRDACDQDAGFVEQDIHDRLAATGLKIDFRLVGYQVADDQREALTRLAHAADAPDPSFTSTPAELAGALNKIANVEPVVDDATKIVSILNPAVTDVNDAVNATLGNHFDVADQKLAAANSAIAGGDTEFQDLRGRANSPVFRSIYGLATDMRAQQGRIVQAASDLLAAARSGGALDSKLAVMKQVGATYNDQVRKMNDLLSGIKGSG